jgi:hypothetical protein
MACGAASGAPGFFSKPQVGFETEPAEGAFDSPLASGFASEDAEAALVAGSNGSVWKQLR